MSAKSSDTQLAKASRYQRLTTLTTLAPDQKQQLWRGLKALEPQTAQLLKDDPTIKTLQQVFDAQVVMTDAEITRFLQAGITEEKPCQA